MSASNETSSSRSDALILRASAYFWLTVLVAVAALGFSIWVADWARPIRFADVLLFMLLNLLAERTCVELPHGSRITASYSILLSSLLLFNAPLAILIACIGNIYAVVYVQRRPWRMALFNCAQYAICFTIAGEALFMASAYSQSWIGHLPLLHSLFAAGVATLTYLVVNIPLINGFVSLQSEPLPMHLWLRRLLVLEDDWLDITQTVFFYPIAVMVVYFYVRDHNVLILMVLMALILGGLRFIHLQMKAREKEEKLVMLYELNKRVGEMVLHDAEEMVTEKMLFDALLTLYAPGDGVKKEELYIRKLIPNDRTSVYRVEFLGADQRIVHENSDGYIIPEKNFRMDDEEEGEPLMQNMVQYKTGGTIYDFKALQKLSVAYYNWKKDFKQLMIEPITIDDQVMYMVVMLRHSEEADKLFNAEEQRLLRLLCMNLEVNIKNIQLRRSMQEQAIKDGLMGVYNHRYLKRKMEEELSRAKRYRKALSLIICDVDYFKKFNDTHGHLLGDRVLREMAQILQDSVRDIDIVARYGGEELAILLPETPLDPACEVAERIRSNVAKFAFTGKDGQVVSLSMSIGVSCTDEDPNLQVSELIIRADTALYKAKNQGRNQICRALVDNGKLIIETFAKGETPKADKPATELRPEARRAWLQAIDRDRDQLMQQIETVLAQGPALPLLRQRLFDELLPKLQRLLIAFGEQARSAELQGDYWSESLSRQLLQLRDRLQPELGDRFAALKLQEVLFTVHAFSLRQAMQLSLPEPERKQVLEACQQFFSPLSGLLLGGCWDHFETRQGQTQALYTILQQLSLLRLNHPAPEGLTQLLALIHQEYPAVDMLMLAVPDPLRERCRPWALWGLEPAASEMLTRQFSFNIQDPRLALRERKRLEVLNFEETFTQGALLREAMPTLQQLWVVPLIYQGDVRGTLCLGFVKPTEPSERQGEWLDTLADELALGLRWLEQQEESEYQMLDALKLLVEMAESSQGQFHSARVSQLSGRLGHKLNMLPAEQRRLKSLAYLHDIGKLVLPAHTKDQPHFRQQHVTLGSRMLEAIPAFKPFAPAVRYHHERWDGSGYPDGLAGSNIPLYARIIGLASAYEHTLEQQGTSPQAAVEYLTKSGYYDPNLCQMLKEIIDHDQVAV